MKLQRWIRRVVFLFALSGTAWAADRYEIDPAHSSMAFAVRHMMLSSVKGDFREFSGELLFDEKDVTRSSARVNIKTASINTDNAKRDSHLRSADFFDAEKFPEITFVSSRVEKNGESLVCVGTLTMHGVSKEVSIPFSYLGKIKDPMGKARTGFEASLTVNRLDYGISWSKTMDNGGLVAGNEVKISLTVEAVMK